MDNFNEWFPWLFSGGTVLTILFVVFYNPVNPAQACLER